MPSKSLPSQICRLGTGTAVILAGLSLLVSGCGGSGGGSSQRDPQVMFVNACPDGPVKVFLNDEDKSGTLATNAFTKFKSIPYISEPDGAYDVGIEEPDRSVNYDQQFGLFNLDSSTMIVANGLKNPADAEKNKRLQQVVIAPNRVPPIGNRARIIFGHMFNRRSPFNTPNLVLKTTGDQPVFISLEVAYSKFTTIDVDSGTYKFYGAGDPRNNNLEVKDPDNDQIYAQNVDPAKPIVLAPGGIYFIMIAGVEPANSAPVEVKVIPIEPENP